MPDNLQILKISCAGGEITHNDVLSQAEQAPGSARRLINYESDVQGGYRRLSGYTNTFTSLPGTGKTLGVAVADGIQQGILAAREPSSGNNFLHYWDFTNTPQWRTVTISPTLTFTNIDKVRFIKYDLGTRRVLIVDGINKAAYYDASSGYVQITHANAPTNPSLATEFKSHIFLAGATDATQLHFSAPLNETDFSPAAGAGVINVGFDIVAIKAFRDQLFIFGSGNIRKLVGNSLADFQLLPVTDDLGCLASDSIVEIGGDILFLGPDGIRPVSATDRIGDVELETVSKNIQSVFNRIVSTEDLSKINTVLVRSKSQMRMFLGNADQAGIILGLRQMSNGGIGYEFGELVGFDTTCAASGYVGTTEFVIHGTSDGKVMQQEVGTSFNGENILSIFSSPFYHMGDPELRKTFQRVSTYFRSEGLSVVRMGVIYDFEDSATINPSDFEITTEGAAAIYNTATFNSSDIYDGNPSPVRRTNIVGSGLSISVVYVTDDTRASHSVQGLTILFGIGDRR